MYQNLSTGYKMYFIIRLFFRKSFLHHSNIMFLLSIHKGNWELSCTFGNTSKVGIVKHLTFLYNMPLCGQFCTFRNQAVHLVIPKLLGSISFQCLQPLQLVKQEYSTCIHTVSKSQILRFMLINKTGK